MTRAPRPRRTHGAPLPADAQPTKDSYENFAASLGVNKSNVSGFGRYQLNPLTRQRNDLEVMYRGSWLIGVAVDAYADDMTREGVEFIGEIEPDDIEKLQAEMVVVGWWQRLNELCKWARLYGGAIAIMLIDGQDVEKELDLDTIAPGQFKGFYIYDRWQLNPSFGDLDTTLGPNVGNPLWYQPVGESPLYFGKKIHHSRCLRMDGILLPYFQKRAEANWGMSIVERLFDRLLAFDSMTTGVGQLTFKAHLRTYSIEGLQKIIAAGGPALEGLMGRMAAIRQFQTSEGMTLIDAKDKVENLTYAFTGLPDIMIQFGQQIAGALQTPLVRLFGQSPVGLNATGDSDWRNYTDGILSQQESRLRNPLRIAFDVLHRSTIGIPPPPSFNFKFKSLLKISHEEKARIAGEITATVMSALGQSLIGPKTALQELRQQADLTGMWTNITDEMIEKAEEDPPDPMEMLKAMGGAPGGPPGLNGGKKPPGSGIPGGIAGFKSPKEPKSDTSQGKADTLE